MESVYAPLLPYKKINLMKKVIRKIKVKNKQTSKVILQITVLICNCGKICLCIFV